MRFLRLVMLMNTASGGDDGGGAGGGTGNGTGNAPHAGQAPAGGAKADGGAGSEPTISMSKSAFDERLSKASDAATRKLLKEMGFENLDGAKGALDTLKKLQDAQKSETERFQSRIKELEPEAERAKTLSKRFEAQVTRDFDALPDNVKTAIEAVAGDDVEKRYAQIEFFKAINSASGAGAPTGQAGAAAPNAPPPAPKNTGPANGPPPQNSGQVTKYQEWKAMVEKNPVQASIFYRSNKAAIEASTPTG